MTDHIQNLWASLVPNHPQIKTHQPISQSRYHNVWKITTTDQAIFAVKHHLFATLTHGKPYDLLTVETNVTTQLLKEGVSVPPIVATSPEHGLAIYEWCGDQTVDDHCQHEISKDITNQIINTLLDLEATFQKHTAQLQSYTAPGSTLQDTLTTFIETVTPLTEILPNLIHTLTNQAPSHLLAHWHKIVANIKESPLRLGPTDYNARNIVLSDTHQPYILELAKIGYDWPERRLIQYTTSLGAHLPTGRIIGLITPEAAYTYAQSAAKYRPASENQILTTLDNHHLIFHLLAALHCLQASTSPHHPWQNIDARLHDIQIALSQPFSNFESALFFRNLFQA